MTVQDNYMPVFNDGMSDLADEQAAFEAFHADFYTWSSDPARVQQDLDGLGYRTIAKRTIVAAVIPVVAVPFLFLGDLAMGLSILTMLISGIAFLICLGTDEGTRPARAKTPKKAIRTFINALKNKQYNRALALTIPDGRVVDMPTRPQLKKAHLGDYVPPRISDVESLKRYSNGFLTSGAGYTRYTNITKIKEHYVDPEKTVVDLELEVEITSTPVWVYFTVFLLIGILGLLVAQKKEKITTHKRLILGANGRWYLCNPAWNGPFDLAPDAKLDH